MRRYALRDDQWDRIEPLLPGKAGDRGRTARNNRLFVEAVLFRYRAGIPWPVSLFFFDCLAHVTAIAPESPWPFATQFKPTKIVFIL